MEFKVKSIEPVGRDEGFLVLLETPAALPPFVVGELVELVEFVPGGVSIEGCSFGEPTLGMSLEKADPPPLESPPVPELARRDEPAATPADEPETRRRRKARP
jgi:hypothetical protein